MSLIADALKAAQREKARHNSPEAGSESPSFFSLKRPPQRKSRKWTLPGRKVLMPVAGAVGIVALGWALNSLLRNRESEPPIITASTRSDTASFAGAPVDTEVLPYEIEEIDDPRDDLPVSAPAVSFPRPEARTSGAEPIIESLPEAPRSEPAPTTIERGNLRIQVEQPRGAAMTMSGDQALAAQNRGDWAVARDIYERMIAAGSTSPEIYQNLGSVYKALGDLARAEQNYKSAVSLDPNFGAAWSNLGIVLYALGKKREAVAAYQEALRADPSDAAAKVNLAILYVENAVYPEARKLLEEALASDPSAEAHYAYAQVMEALGDRSAAVRHYNLFLAASAGRFAALEIRVRSHITRLTGAR
ncbi:MAG: tetratricopeptide repeat protein [Gemmatimonadota bacterium]